MPEDDEPETPAQPAPGDGTGPADAGTPDAEALARTVTKRPARTVDPEDWASSGGDDDDRYLRERPPHW